MEMFMKAAVFTEVGKPLAIEDLELQPPKQGEVKIKMAASGVCHTDLSVMNGTLPGSSPMVLGHEGAGVVEEVGPGVTSVAPGDHVVTCWVGQCGYCYMCLRNEPNLCENSLLIQALGTQADMTPRFERADGTAVHQFCGTGTFSPYSVLPEFSVVKIRKDMPLDVAALLGCGVLTGVGSVFNSANVSHGSSVAVIGLGGVGLSVIQGARIAGATQIIAVGRAEDKLELARKMGATHTVNNRDVDGVTAVKALTETTPSGTPRGVDYSFEAVGTSGTVQEAIGYLRRGGTMCFLGVPQMSDKLELNIFGELFFNNKTVMGGYYGGANAKRDIPELVDHYLAGRLMLDELISNRIPVDKVNEAFDSMQSGGLARSLITYD